MDSIIVPGVWERLKTVGRIISGEEEVGIRLIDAAL